MTPAREITGSNEFAIFYKSLSEDNPFKKEINKAKKILLENCTGGDKIEHDRWPDHYTKKYKINNLWRYDLTDGKRFGYTILGSPSGFTVSIIESFSSHAEYEKRFGY